MTDRRETREPRDSRKESAEKQEAVEKQELSAEAPPMQLEQDHYGLWEYWQDPWLYGPGVAKNGVIPVSISKREDAEAYVNKLYPGSFPETPPEEVATEETRRREEETERTRR